MKKISLLVLAMACILLLASCEQEGPMQTMFQDHFIFCWADSLKGLEIPIVFYGDSRVRQANWEEAYPDSKVINLGVGGDIVEGCIQRLPLLEAVEAKYCFLAIGGNNALSSHFSERYFEEAYDELLSKLEEMNIEVFAMTVVNLTTENCSFQEKEINRKNACIDRANEIIIRLAEQHEVTLIDVREEMNGTDGKMLAAYSSDGVHFNQAGLDKWYEILRPYVESVTD